MMTAALPQVWSATAQSDARRTLWNHFILARALGRMARMTAAQVTDGAIPFCYVDTHAGSGRIPRPSPFLDRIFEQRQAFAGDDYFLGLEPVLPDGEHPGSWVLAGRVIEAAGGDRLVVEIDVNDIDAALVAQGRSHREGTWVRFWSHDWFSFLRSHLSLTAAPNFVFIDPPPGDTRGPAFAIDAALLLETLKVPFMISYSADTPQEPIDQIGRTGLELITTDGGTGVLLGGGAETLLLDILPDLRLLAGLLGGTFFARLPRFDDYSI
jgi:hypothetical protein